MAKVLNRKQYKPSPRWHPLISLFLYWSEWANTFTSIFLGQMKAIVFLILQIFLQRARKIYEQLTFHSVKIDNYVNIKWIFSGLISTTAQVVEITAKIAFIFTSLSPVHIYGFHLFFSQRVRQLILQYGWLLVSSGSSHHCPRAR